MEDLQLLRYSRQIMLPQIDIAGQEKLLNARVLQIGLGGLGSPAALYLAASGVGNLVICDDDEVDLSNLQRQLLHQQADIGRAKTDSAKASLALVNAGVSVHGIKQRLQGEALLQQVTLADVVLDCSDNFTSRFALNRACIQTKTPLVSGAAIRFEGQLAVFDSRAKDSPCYECLYSDSGRDDSQLSCSESGILPPVVGTIGTLQALEAIKLITGAGETSHGYVSIFDGLSLEWRKLKLKPRSGCPSCGTTPPTHP